MDKDYYNKFARVGNFKYDVIYPLSTHTWVTGINNSPVDDTFARVLFFQWGKQSICPFHSFLLSGHITGVQLLHQLT